MANQITDNRTLVNNADSVTNWVGSPTLDTEIFIQGTGSIGEQVTNTLRTILYNTGATQNWANNTFYLWINCGIVGLLATKASGGFRIRFTGPTTTNFFEVYVGGSDDWPNSVAGGWVQFVVNIELARATAVSNGWTGGTPPATSAIQHIGYAAITGGTMTRTTDNTWIDAIWRLPQNTPGIIVEGRNGGTTPWNFANIFTALGQGAGSFRPGPGGSYVINTPLQIGINDTTTHSFSDTNQLILWDYQEYIGSGFYSLSALGNAGGTTSVVLGSKVGTGNDASGSQGCTFTASSTTQRWTVAFDDPNIDTVGLYGCTFQHTADMQLDDPAVETVNCQYIDCGGSTISNSIQLKNTVSNIANSAGFASMVTDDLTDIRYCSFTGNPDGAIPGGHAIEITSAAGSPYSFLGNTFTNFGPDPRSFNTGTGVNSTTDVITLDANHGYGTGWAIYYQDQGGAQNIGLTDGNLYYVRVIASNQLAFYTTRANAVADTGRVNLTSGGSETHWIYSGSAAIYNSSGAAITINVSAGGNTPTIRNSNGSSTTVNNAVTLTISNVVPDSEVRIFTDDANRTELAGTEQIANGTLSAIQIANGGTGYTVNDVLTISGGTFTSAATITVTSVSSGVITGVSITTPGSGYSVAPTNPVSVTGGTGSGATFTATIRGSLTYSYNYTTDTPIIIVVFHLNYKDIWLVGQSLLNSNQTIPVQQIGDRVYLNPA